MSTKVTEITGQRFGMLTVEARAAPPAGAKTTGAYWLCRCDCGGTKIANGGMLRRGLTGSCGCRMEKQTQSFDMTGQKVGMLTVLEKVPRPEGETRYRQRCAWYRCRCECGREVTAASRYLRDTGLPSCGCRAREIKEHQRQIGQGMMATIEHDRKERQRRREMAEELQKCVNERICACCKKPFECYAGERWAYRRQRHGRIHIFCSWKCLRKWEKENPARVTEYLE